MSSINKRKRSNNFSSTEKELLLKFALPMRTVLENKTSNAVTWKNKENTWEEIAMLFNSQTPESVNNASDSQRSKNLTELELELFKSIQVPVGGIQLDFDADINQEVASKHNVSNASTSQKVSNLTKEKLSLVCLQRELVKQELEQGRELHQLKMKHLNEEHDLRIIILQCECKKFFSSQ